MSDLPSEKVVKIGVIPTQEYTWTYKIKSGDSKATSKLQYKDNFEGWETRMPLEGTQHPDIRGLYLVEIDAAREEGLIINVNLLYESSNWKNDLPGRAKSEKSQERFLARPSLSDEPLLSHPKVDLLPEEAKNALLVFLNSSRLEADYSTASAVCVNEENGSKFLADLRRGQESYRVRRTVWVRTRTITDLAEINFLKIGRIDTPPQDKDGRPQTPSGRNWMYLAPDINNTSDGLAYDVTEYWELSDEGGWDTYYYSMPD